MISDAGRGHHRLQGTRLRRRWSGIVGDGGESRRRGGDRRRPSHGCRRQRAPRSRRIGWQRDLSVSYNKLGDVLVAQGNLPEALKTYRDGLSIRDHLAKADPGNAGWQRDLAVSHAKLAITHGGLGQAREARGVLETGRSIVAGLVTRFPGWAQWERDLAGFDAMLGAADET